MNSNVVIYDTNALLEYNQHIFWVTQAHSYFKSQKYIPIIPKNVEREVDFHIKKQTLNSIGLPYLEEGFSLDTLLEEDILSIDPTRTNFQEISYVEKSVNHYDSKLRGKEPLDLADRDIISLVDDLMFEDENRKIAILSGDLKLSEVIREISIQYDKENIQVINPYEKNWWNPISFRNTKFIFSLDVIKKLHENPSISYYLRVHPNKIKVKNNSFHYVYDTYPDNAKKKGTQDILVQRNNWNVLKTIQDGDNAIYPSLDNELFIYSFSGNIPPKIIKNIKKGNKGSKKNLYEKSFQIIASKYTDISKIISITPQQLKILTE